MYCIRVTQVYFSLEKRGQALGVSATTASDNVAPPGFDVLGFLSFFRDIPRVVLNS